MSFLVAQVDFPKDDWCATVARGRHPLFSWNLESIIQRFHLHGTTLGRGGAGGWGPRGGRSAQGGAPPAGCGHRKRTIFPILPSHFPGKLPWNPLGVGVACWRFCVCGTVRMLVSRFVVLMVVVFIFMLKICENYMIFGFASMMYLSFFCVENSFN